MNPHFKARVKAESPIPQCFVYIPDQYMKKYIHEIKGAITEYQDAIEFVFTSDHTEINKHFYTDDYPDVMPFMVIVDKSKKIPVQPLGAELRKPEEIVLEGDEAASFIGDFYYPKYKDAIFMSNLKQEVGKFITRYLDGEIQPYFSSERMKQQTLVKKICSDNFEEEIVSNPNVEQCLIEIFKHDCPSCQYNGKVFNIFSRKLERYNVPELPCY